MTTIFQAAWKPILSLRTLPQGKAWQSPNYKEQHIQMDKQGFIYILANNHNTVLYVGVTSNLIRRVYEHKNKLVQGFTNKYNVDKWVYYEVFDNIVVAIEREKQIKKRSRKYKDLLINEFNPNWEDLYEKLFD